MAEGILNAGSGEGERWSGMTIHTLKSLIFKDFLGLHLTPDRV